MSRHGPRIGFVALLLICAFAVLAGYWPGLPAPFQFDSIPAIAANADLRFHSRGFDEWYAAAFSSAAGPSGRPLAMLTFALNSATTGPDAVLPFRLTALFIHVLNGVLLALAVVRLHSLYASAPSDSVLSDRSSLFCGLIAGSIFLLHPIQLTAVLHDVQRMTLLACTFQMLALLVYLKGRPAWSPFGAGRVRACHDLTWIALLTVLGCLCKESALLTPLLLLVTEAFFFSRRPRLALFAAFFVPLALLAAWLSLGGDRTLDAMYATRDFDLRDRLLTQTRVLWIYLYWLASPGSLSAGWHHDDITVSHSLADPGVLVAAGGWVVVAAFVGCSAGRRGAVCLTGFAFAWFLVSHLMESTVVPLEMAFEHRNYGALCGLLLGASTGLLALRERLPAPAGIAVPVVLVVALWGLLYLRATAWSDPLTLAVFSEAERPRSLRARADLALAKFNLALRNDDRALAAQARDDWERLADAAPRDLFPLARLVETESILGDATRQDAVVARFIRALEKPLLSTQDWIGLSLVEQCVVSRGCLDAARAGRLLAALSARADMSPATIALMRARISLGSSGNPRDALAQIASGPPLSTYGPSELVEMAVWHGMLGEPAMALERVRDAMRKDERFLRTAVLRRLYSPDTD